MGTVVAPSGPWSLGTLIWVPICIVLVLVLCSIGKALLTYPARNNVGKEKAAEARVVGVVVFVIAALFAIGTLVGMYPYDSEFHQWRPVTGKVEAVSDRLVGDGKGMQQRFVLVIDGQPFAVDDTRAALVKVGDVVSLSCKREFEYASTSGWGCRWGR